MSLLVKKIINGLYDNNIRSFAFTFVRNINAELIKPLNSLNQFNNIILIIHLVLPLITKERTQWSKN